MHELSICTALLAQVLDAADQAGGATVSAITLCVGPLSGVEPSQLRRAFTIVSMGTRCEGAGIDFDPSAVRVHCRSCGETTEALPNRLLCAACGEWRVRLVSGDEMRLVGIEITKEKEEVLF